MPGRCDICGGQALVRHLDYDRFACETCRKEYLHRLAQEG